MKKIFFTLFINAAASITLGQTWTTTLNTGSTLKLGLSSSDPISMYTANTLRMTLDATGKLTLNDLIGTSNRFVYTDATGLFKSFPAGTASQVLFGNGTWGSLPSAINSFDLTGSGSTQQLSTTAPFFGIGTSTPAHALDVVGDGKFSGNLTVSGNMTLNNSVNVGPNFGIVYTPGTATSPGVASYIPTPGGGGIATTKVKLPCNMFYQPNGTSLTIVQTVNAFPDLIQVFDANATSVLSVGLYNSDGIIAIQPLPGLPTGNKLRLNPTCVNDVNICEGGGFTKIFNSAGVVGNMAVTNAVQIGAAPFLLNSSLEMNMTGLAGAISILDPNSTATEKHLFQVGSTGKTLIGTNIQNNTSMLTVGQAAKTNLALCLTDNTNTTNQNYFSVYGDGQTYIGPTLAQTIGSTGAMLTVGQSQKNALAFCLTDNTSITNKPFFSVSGNGYTEIDVYSPAGMPVPAYSGASNPRVFTIRDASSNNKDLFVVNAVGKVYAREVEINVITNFADYVFNKEYHLKTISEVAAYIETNKHLPGFEKAEHYEKNGMNVGELIIKQQEKLEEQMLYIIQLEKRLQGLDELKKRLDALEKNTH